MSGQEHIFPKIKALRTVNDEILSRIQGKSKTTSFHYSITQQPSQDPHQPPLFELSEKREEVPTAEVIKNWKCKAKFVEIPDLFNDKLNYKVEDFEGLLNCYKGMCSVIDRVYAFFGEAIGNVPALPSFKQNFEMVQVCLGEVEGLVMEQKSKKEALLEKVSALNQLAKELSLEGNVSFGGYKGMSKGVFKFVSDFDENGILYWLGTKEGKEPYSNPVDIGLVNVKAYQWCQGNLPISAGIGWAQISGSAYTNLSNYSSLPSWFEISFLKHKVTPTYYSYRGDENTNSYTPRNWNFEGSNDGNNWEILRSHTNDTSLQKVAHCVGSWPLQNISKSYQHFRINLTGPNAFNSSDYHLMIQGFEIYGTLQNI
eukprot:TRINITY_DN11062_c0_g1_i4.p1 TRINITY_DN11062_c0_g1~~TRINITY_DN11062_c0_g1_i4.p1  ORF type:complete len:370 (+),score=103.93 TRINITY_DN11062_c0_g1_i4:3-1112(+)